MSTEELLDKRNRTIAVQESQIQELQKDLDAERAKVTKLELLMNSSLLELERANHSMAELLEKQILQSKQNTVLH